MAIVTHQDLRDEGMRAGALQAWRACACPVAYLEGGPLDGTVYEITKKQRGKRELRLPYEEVEVYYLRNDKRIATADKHPSIPVYEWNGLHALD